MTAPPQLPRQERRDRVRTLAEAGLSARSIARELGVNRATVGRDLARLGLRAGDEPTSDPGTVPSGRDRAFHDALWAHVEHLHLRGLADTHITKRRREVERLQAFLGHSPLTATLAAAPQHPAEPVRGAEAAAGSCPRAERRGRVRHWSSALAERCPSGPRPAGRIVPRARRHPDRPSHGCGRRASRRPSAATPVGMTTAWLTTRRLTRALQYVASRNTYGNACPRPAAPGERADLLVELRADRSGTP